MRSFLHYRKICWSRIIHKQVWKNERKMLKRKAHLTKAKKYISTLTQKGGKSLRTYYKAISVQSGVVRFYSAACWKCETSGAKKVRRMNPDPSLLIHLFSIKAFFCISRACLRTWKATRSKLWIFLAFKASQAASIAGVLKKSILPALWLLTHSRLFFPFRVSYYFDRTIINIQIPYQCRQESFQLVLRNPIDSPPINNL